MLMRMAKVLPVVLALTGCADADEDDDDGGSEGDDSSGADESGTGDCESDVEFPAVDETPCAPLATDYQPGAQDDYPDCVADDGEWTAVLEDPPGSADRTVAYDDILALLRSGTEPTPDDFTMARTRYSIGEGLESRIVRREDIHFPVIPETDQDPGVDFDKQCTVGDNVSTYADRCVGPAKISPIINEAFAAGMSGEGDPNVHAARIDAAITWFMFVSPYKESASCIILPEDCDAHRGYFQGAEPRDMPIGWGAQVDALSPMAYDAVYDAMLAIRCWRDLYPGDADPTWDELGPDGQAMYIAAHEQLDNALWYALARTVRDHVEQQPIVCGSDADANWAYLQILGPVLEPEAQRRDATAAGTLTSVFASATPPAPEMLQAAVAAIDTAFPCPQCPDCTVEGYPY